MASNENSKENSREIPKESVKEPKKQRPDFKKEITGIVLAGISVIFLLSLIWGTFEFEQNLIGVAGNFLFRSIFSLLGLSSFAMAAGLMFISFSLIRNQILRFQIYQIIGTVLLITGISAFIHIAANGFLIAGLKIEGIAGYYLGRFVKSLFGAIGGGVISVVLFMTGLTLTTSISSVDIMVSVFSFLKKVFLFLFRKTDEALDKTIPDNEAGKSDKNMEEVKIIKPEKPAIEVVKKDDEVKAEPRITKTPALSEKKKEKTQKKKEEKDEKISVSDGEYILPSTSLLKATPRNARKINEEELKEYARRLEEKFRNFDIESRVVNIRPGPVITMYEMAPGPGVKLSKILALSNDIAMALEATKVRILAPIPGKSVVGVEVPNREREGVFLREILEDKAFTDSNKILPLAIGKNSEGAPFVVDLTKMPHLLVAGATGAGKSVSVNTMLMSILFKHHPDEVKFILVDPKVVELSIYEGIPHLMLPVVTDPQKAAIALKWAVNEMEKRYHKLAMLGVRDIVNFNKKADKILKGDEKIPEGYEEMTGEPLKKLEYIVLIVDEFADLMMVAPKDVESCVTRLSQMARAVGIHLILATQRPSTDVISGIIKANFPARISFRVASQIDSRTILDSQGAEALLGMGDMLVYLPGASNRLERVHGAYVDEEEIKEVVKFLKSQGSPVYKEEILEVEEVTENSEGSGSEDERLYQEAVNIVKTTRNASISMLQRRLNIGFNRAARLVEQMEREGIVGPANGSKPRQVLI
ncbi:MAG: DNA translocase FtsK 4TM domain-containing protein [Deltaproteobacteria bacterium]|nr:DNA translocase FtsK 4TM domain-containing protein [Deltaproteobacteria bacterium]